MIPGLASPFPLKSTLCMHLRGICRTIVSKRLRFLSHNSCHKALTACANTLGEVPGLMQTFDMTILTPVSSCLFPAKVTNMKLSASGSAEGHTYEKLLVSTISSLGRFLKFKE